MFRPVVNPSSLLRATGSYNRSVVSFVETNRQFGCELTVSDPSGLRPVGVYPEEVRDVSDSRGLR